MSRRKRFANWIQSLPEGCFMAFSISIWLFAYVVEFGMHRVGFKVGIWRSPGHLDLQDVFLAAVTGFIVGALDLFDRHRKQETARLKAAGQDRTMI
jgi:hypothetical protein